MVVTSRSSPCMLTLLLLLSLCLGTGTCLLFQPLPKLVQPLAFILAFLLFERHLLFTGLLELLTAIRNISFDHHPREVPSIHDLWRQLVISCMKRRIKNKTSHHEYSRENMSEHKEQAALAKYPWIDNTEDTWESLRTFTQASAASTLLYRTLATPLDSLSKRTTFVTGPILAHSSRMSSFISRMAAGSSCRQSHCKHAVNRNARSSCSGTHLELLKREHVF